MKGVANGVMGCPFLIKRLSSMHTTPRTHSLEILRHLSEYRGPGGLTASQIFAKVQESRARDAEYYSDKMDQESFLRAMTADALKRHLKALDVDVGDLVNKEDLVKLAKTHQAKVPEPIRNEPWRK